MFPMDDSNKQKQHRDKTVLVQKGNFTYGFRSTQVNRGYDIFSLSIMTYKILPQLIYNKNRFVCKVATVLYNIHLFSFQFYIFIEHHFLLSLRLVAAIILLRFPPFSLFNGNLGTESAKFVIPGRPHLLFLVIFSSTIFFLM